MSVVGVVDADDEGELAGLVLQHLRIRPGHVRKEPCHAYIHTYIHTHIHRNEIKIVLGYLGSASP